MSSGDNNNNNNGPSPSLFQGYEEHCIVPFDSTYAVPFAFPPNEWPLWKQCKAPILIAYEGSPVHVTDPEAYCTAQALVGICKKSKSRRPSKKARKEQSKPSKAVTLLVGPQVELAKAAPPCVVLGQIVPNLALEAKLVRWPQEHVPLASACMQIIILIVANYSLPDVLLNHPSCPAGGLINSQRTMAKNLIGAVCFYYAAGHMGAKFPGKYEGIVAWCQHPGKEQCLARYKQIIEWVIKHFGGKTDGIRDTLKKDQEGKNAKGKAKGAINKKLPHRINRSNDFKMTITEEDIEELHLSNNHGTTKRKLKELGVSSVEYLHSQLVNGNDLSKNFFRAVPLPLALIHNWLLFSARRRVRVY